MAEHMSGEPEPITSVDYAELLNAARAQEAEAPTPTAAETRESLQQQLDEATTVMLRLAESMAEERHLIMTVPIHADGHGMTSLGEQGSARQVFEDFMRLTNLFTDAQIKVAQLRQQLELPNYDYESIR